MDDMDKTGGQDRLRININQEHELDYWTSRFDVTRDELRAAVEQAGVEAKEVERLLNSRKGN